MNSRVGPASRPGPEPPRKGRGAAEAVARAVAERFLGGPCAVRPIRRQGSCNLAFRAARDGRAIVVRLNRDRDPAELAKEAWCMERAAAAGVRVPAPLGRGRPGGWRHGVQGDAGDRDGGDVADPLPVWAFLGASARRLGRVRIEGFGERLSPAEGRFGGSWSGHLRDDLAALRADPVLARLGRARSGRLRGRIGSLEGWRPRIGLCHGDLAPRNVVLGRGGMTLVDWGCARAHAAPHFDLRELLREHPPESPEARAFLGGHGAGPGREALLAEAVSVLLLDAFDLVRWARDRAPGRVAEKEAALVTALDRLVP